MDSFAELVRAINKGRRFSTDKLPNTDPLSSGNITDIRNAGVADKILEQANDKSEKAFNSALNSYFKKFGLKYKNGKLTSPTVDKAIERMAKKAEANKVSADTLNAIVNALNNKGVSVGTGINGANPNSKIEDTNPLSQNSITDIRNNGQNLLGK